MANEHHEYFDIPTLLKHNGSLDVRRLAEAKPSLLLKNYFTLLSDFLELQPGSKQAFDKFAACDGDGDAFRTLNRMVHVLEELGWNKPLVNLHSIMDAYRQGNWRLASTLTQNIIKEFDSLFDKITAAKRAGTLFEGDGTLSVDLTLKEYLARLDEEEANRKLVILAVDDSPVILKTVSSVLSTEYKVYTLAKPAMLQETLEKITPELFLLDYNMPDITGFELIPTIRGFLEHKETPIIFLTSSGTADYVSGAVMLGACDFIVKPVDPDILREKIAKHITRKKVF